MPSDRLTATYARSPESRAAARLVYLLLLWATACADGAYRAGRPAHQTDTLQAVSMTDVVPNDADDPAIWVDSSGQGRSVILGTDKGDTTGGIFVFDLAGHIDSIRSRSPLRRMNNVDVAYGLAIRGGRIDVAVGTERGRQRLRVFRLPDMSPIDDGGIPVFDNDSSRAPMGIALYRRPRDGAVFAIVGRKSGPTRDYLWQYRLEDRGDGTIRGVRVRTFGRFSGRKEIEAITVDDALGYVYYSDETVGIRKYHADPDHPQADVELALIGTSGFVQDHEGLAVYPTSPTTGYLIASDQQGQRIQLFRREGEGGAPHDHRAIATIPVSAMETDGLEVTEYPVSERFPQGLLVMMSTDRRFHYFDWRDVIARIPLPAR
ncbi:MAG: hypothetical protein RLZZ621_473 [Gemmatimonadota bacterium]|jgi:3-phytase